MTSSSTYTERLGSPFGNSTWKTILLDQGRAHVSPVTPAVINVLIHESPLGACRNFPRPRLLPPHLAGAGLATSIGGNAATGTSPDGLPERKIFPGIVYDAVRRGSLLGQMACNE